MNPSKIVMKLLHMWISNNSCVILATEFRKFHIFSNDRQKSQIIRRGEEINHVEEWGNSQLCQWSQFTACSKLSPSASFSIWTLVMLSLTGWALYLQFKVPRDLSACAGQGSWHENFRWELSSCAGECTWHMGSRLGELSSCAGECTWHMGSRLGELSSCAGECT